MFDQARILDDPDAGFHSGYCRPYPRAKTLFCGHELKSEKVYTSLYFFGGQNSEKKNPANSLS
jgi:hypothetical protein